MIPQSRDCMSNVLTTTLQCQSLEMVTVMKWLLQWAL